MLRRRYVLNWIFEAPDAVLTCSILKCSDKSYLVFGGHDRTLYLMDNDLMIHDDITFDGWCRCTYPIDLDGDECDEILVGTGDGRFIILKLNKKTMKLEGIMNYKSGGMINCCVAGDWNSNGNIELMFGGEDKTFKILKNIYAEKPIITLYYDSWVTACAFGYLKLPNFEKPIASLLIGTRNGLLQLIQLAEDYAPDILWQQNVYAEINDIKIGDVTNDGHNEIIIASDDSYIKIFDSMGNRLKFIHIEEILTSSKKPKKLNRPKTLLIEDIDGDKANEIVVGCADGTLRIFHNQKLDSKNFELKWKTTPKHSASIKKICSLIDNEQNIRFIIYGGYERTIRNISDFEWGKKPFLKIPVRFKISPIPLKMIAENAEIHEIKKVPTNLREFIKELLEIHGFYMTLDLLINQLMEKGYDRNAIEEEIELMKSEGVMRYEKMDVNVWSLVSEEIDEIIDRKISKSPSSNTGRNEIEKKSQKKENSPYNNKKDLEQIIIKLFKERKVITKTEELINLIIAMGYSKNSIEEQINHLKNKKVIRYSRSKPLGWTLVN
ncbi:MAG: hypothetical protein ACFFAH_06310 [Promethearchaeota archaeon]